MCVYCTSVLVSLLCQMTTPAVPNAALSPIVLTRSVCGEKRVVESNTLVCCSGSDLRHIQFEIYIDGNNGNALN